MDLMRRFAKNKAKKAGSSAGAPSWDKRSEKSSMTENTATGPQKLGRVRTKLRLLGRLGGARNLAPTQEVVHYENTYQLEPEDSHRFSTQKAEQIISSVLEGYLKGKAYDPKKFPLLCKSLSELIKERVKNSGLTRYKIVATVTIVEKNEQSMQYASRCLWEPKLDNYATASYEDQSFIAVGSVYAAYYD